jgi:glycosyltransferase involved in cell wall biosynthesis
VRLIPDGVDLSRFVPSRDNAVRSEFKVRPEARLIVMVARLEPVKGHNVFFQALKELAQNAQMPPIHALCACDERTAGVYAATVSAARALGLNEETLSFTGLRPDIEKLLAAADVVALPSLGSEGSSRVGLEAAACGVPVVASRVGCLSEVIAEGETGLLTPPGDAHALAEALLALLKDPQRVRLMGEKARRRAEALYDEQLMVENLEQLYLEMVDGRRQ